MPYVVWPSAVLAITVIVQRLCIARSFPHSSVANAVKPVRSRWPTTGLVV